MRSVMQARALGLLMLLCVLGVALTTVVVALTMPGPGPTAEEVKADVEEAQEEVEAKRSPATKDLPPAPEPVDTSGLNAEAMEEEAGFDRAAFEAELDEAFAPLHPTSTCHQDRSACDTSQPGIQTEGEMEAAWEAAGRPSEPMPEAQRAKICAATGRECG